MPEFFVWSRPGLVNIIEAESEQDAAEEFLGQSVTKAPVLDEPPACFVQKTGGNRPPKRGHSNSIPTHPKRLSQNCFGRNMKMSGL
jgi:hypothetical protein